MTPKEKNQLLKTFFNAIPLQVTSPPGDNSVAAYVPGLHSSEGRDPVGELATNIGFNEGAASYLFTGHRGTGKTTELIRLQASLEEAGCVAFYVDMVDYLNETSPIGVSYLLTTMLGALSEAFDARYAANPLQQSWWERFKHFVQATTVTPSEIGLSGGLDKLATIDIKLALKTNPHFKQIVQTALDGALETFMKDAREFADEIVAAIRESTLDPGKKVVLIVDSLEKIRGSGAGAEQIYASINDTFHGNATNLRFNTLHVVYSVPPTLPLIAPGIGSLYSGGLCGLPQVTVESRGEPGQPNVRYEHGIEQMIKVVATRVSNWESVFARPHLERLARVSGGNLRIFFLLIQRVLLKAPSVDLPLANETLIEQAENDVRADMQLTDEDRVWLTRVANTHSSGLDKIDNLATLGRLCDNLLILDYRNGDLWYDVLPLVRERL